MVLYINVFVLEFVFLGMYKLGLDLFKRQKTDYYYFKQIKIKEFSLLVSNKYFQEGFLLGHTPTPGLFPKTKGSFFLTCIIHDVDRLKGIFRR